MSQDYCRNCTRITNVNRNPYCPACRSASGTKIRPVHHQEWAEQSLCSRGDVLPPDAWFVESPKEAKLAKRVCADCPVRQKCLELALQARDLEHGIYGGMTPGERRTLIRKGRAA